MKTSSETDPVEFAGARLLKLVHDKTAALSCDDIDKSRILELACRLIAVNSSIIIELVGNLVKTTHKELDHTDVAADDVHRLALGGIAMFAEELASLLLEDATRTIIIKVKIPAIVSKYRRADGTVEEGDAVKVVDEVRETCARFGITVETLMVMRDKLVRGRELQPTHEAPATKQ